MNWLARILSMGDSHAASREPWKSVRGDPERAREAWSVLEELRPLVAMDGGDVELVSVDDGWVEIRLRGSCTSCHMSDTTVRGAVEPRLRERLAWVRGVRVAS